MGAKFNRSEFIATFRAEAEEHLGKLSKGLVSLEKDPNNAEILKELFRIAHTLKGVARMMGFFEIQEIAHRIEDIFGAASDKKIKFNPDISNRIFKALDAIKDIIGKILKSEKIDIDVTSVCSDLELYKDDAKAKRPPGVKAKAAQVKEEAPATPAPDEAGLPKEGITVSSLSTAAPAEEYVRVSLSRVNKLLNLVGELVINKINTSQKIIALKKITKLTKEHQKRLSEFFEGFRNSEYFKLSDVFKQSLESLHHCNVDAERVKEEMLAIFENISNEALHMDPIIDELQERMKGIRMLPCFTIFDEFPRLVRDIAYEQRKKINLVVTGEETELDKKVLEEIKSPLIHILRNCVDHGIEAPEERRALGKPEEGLIKLSASQEGSQVVIRVEDDGRGLELDKIKETIIKKKLSSQDELGAMSESDIYAFIFRSGFSTSPIITDISGRGVGLDIVKNQIDKLKGKVHIESEKSKGLRVTLELPLTIAIIDVLLVKISGQTYALPMLSIEESLKINRSDISTVENKMAIQIREHTVPLVNLAEILGIMPPGEGEEVDTGKKEHVPVVIAVSLQKKVGLIVDGIIGEQEVFIKSLGAHLGKIKNVSGATVLGTGDVIVILDVADLIASSRTLHPALAPRAASGLRGAGKRRILVVEDSLTTRELERSILESQGYHVDTAIDGLEALDKLAQGKYDLIVCDVQMPRMNGFEFCKTFKQNERYRNIPIIFVTSMAKEEDKRRGIEVGAQAYIVKSSFDQTNLADTISRLIG